MTSPLERMVWAAIGYGDQLYAFNRVDHPEVRRWRRELIEAVGDAWTKDRAGMHRIEQALRPRLKAVLRRPV